MRTITLVLACWAFLAHSNDFDRLLDQHRNLTAEAYLGQLPTRSFADGPGFDVTSAKYWDLVQKTLALSPGDQQTLQQHGVVTWPANVPEEWF